MSEKATQSKTTIACPTPLVLFGIDSRGKPKAARFGKQHAGLARKAATQLQLQVLAGNDPKIADLDRSAAGWPRPCHWPDVRAVRSPRPLRPACCSRWQRKRSSSKLIERIVRGVGVNAWRLGAAFAAELARDRHRRSGALSRLSGGRLVRGIRRRSCWRHVHVALARLPAATSVCAPSAAARLALSGTQTERRDRQISESFRPGKARRTVADPSGYQRHGAAQRLG